MAAKPTFKSKTSDAALDDSNIEVMKSDPVDIIRLESSISVLDSERNSYTSDTDSCDSALHSPDLDPSNSDEDSNEEDQEDKAALIAKYSELYSVLNDLLKKTMRVKEQNEQVRRETENVTSYMHELMDAVSVLKPLKKF